MLWDGLEDAYERRHMGYFAEMCAKNGFTRQEQELYAIGS